MDESELRLPLAGKASGPIGQEAHASLKDVLGHMLALPLPDALDVLLTRVEAAREGEVSGAELYAARVLADAGARSVCSLAGKHGLPTGKLASTGLFWIGANLDALDAASARAVLGVEAALNRLALIEPVSKRLAGGMLSPESYAAALYILDVARLRALPVSVAAAARAYEHENPLRTLYGADALRGGDWDVRTRFAAACESAKLPCRLQYRFDCDVRTGAVAVEFAVPPACSFPRSRWDVETGAWASVADGEAAATAYALRTAGLLALLGFGCGSVVRRVTVTARLGSLEGDPAFSLAFDRVGFFDAAYPRIAEGALDDLPLDASAASLIEVLEPAECSADILPDGSIGLVGAPLPAGTAHLRPALKEDARPLPPELAGLLRADAVSDLEVMDDSEDVLIDRVRDSYFLAATEPARAVERLEDVVAAYDVCEMDPARLFCSDPVSRLVIDLVPAEKGARYTRMLDSEFAARSFLGKLYRTARKPERALAMARECIEFAPTTSNGYLDAAAALVDLERYDEAGELLVQALRVTVLPMVVAYIYYRLAYVYWLMGKGELALACYALVGDGEPISERSRVEMERLMVEMRVVEKPSQPVARQTLADAGVPVAPTLEALRLMVTLAAKLGEEGFPRAAAPLARLLGGIYGGDVLEVVASSLAHGIEPGPAPVAEP